MCRHRDTDYTYSSLDVIKNRAISDYLLLQFLLISALFFTLSIVYVLLNMMHLAGSPTHLRHVSESPAPDMALSSLLARFLLILFHPFRMPEPSLSSPALLPSPAQVPAAAGFPALLISGLPSPDTAFASSVLVFHPHAL